MSRCDLQQCKKSHMISTGDQQEKSNVFCVFRGIFGSFVPGENDKLHAFCYTETFSILRFHLRLVAFSAVKITKSVTSIAMTHCSSHLSATFIPHSYFFKPGSPCSMKTSQSPLPRKETFQIHGWFLPDHIILMNHKLSGNTT